MKRLLILLIIFVVVALLFFAVKVIMKHGTEQISLGGFSADLRISKASIINYEEIDVQVKKSYYDEKLKGINLIVYDKEDNEIGDYPITIEELKEDEFRAVLILENTSRISKISISPIILSDSGEEYPGGIQDIYKISSNGVVFPPIEPGAGYSKESVIFCDSTSDCRDNNPCTVGVCQSGTCTYPTTPGCCKSESECDDGDDCTTDSCSDKICSYTLIKDCESCNESSQCDDSNPCTEDECINKKCFYTEIEDCSFCTSNSQCNDNNSCTTDICYPDGCSNLIIPGCTPCDSDHECGEGRICANSICVVSVNITKGNET